VSKINGRLKDIPFRCHGRPAQGGRQFLRRSYAEHDDRSASPGTPTMGRGYNVLEGGQQRLPAVHAVTSSPVKTTGMSDSVSRQKIFHLQACERSRRTRPARSRIVANLARKAFAAR